MAIIYSYLTGIGSGDTSAYGSVPMSPVIWLVFLGCTILINIILLNLLISIIGNTFCSVTAIWELSNLREICTLISENDFLLNYQREFRNSKYIIVARLEKALQVQVKPPEE